MPTFQVNITITSYGETTIEADSLEEAKQLAEDLAAGDFDFIDGSDDEREVIEVEEFTCKCGAEFLNEGDLIHHKLTWC